MGQFWWDSLVRVTTDESVVHLFLPASAVAGQQVFEVVVVVVVLLIKLQK